MEIYNKLPDDIRNKIFIHFRSPSAERIKFHYSDRGKLMDDIRHFPKSLKQLYNLPHACISVQLLGRASLLNSLWREAHMLFGDYYKIWERMYRIQCPNTAKWWIGSRYAVHCHIFQINSLWALFTKEERNNYLHRFIF